MVRDQGSAMTTAGTLQYCVLKPEFLLLSMRQLVVREHQVESVDHSSAPVRRAEGVKQHERIDATNYRRRRM